MGIDDVQDGARPKLPTNIDLPPHIAEALLHAQEQVFNAEGELEKKEEILEKVFDNIPVMIGFVGDDGGVKLVNPEWERTIGWTLEELQEQKVDIFVEAYPDLSYRQQVLDFVAAATGEWVDLKIKVRDGRVIDAACAVVHLSDGTKIAIARDVTERKRAEALLHAKEQEFRAIVENAPDQIIRYDREFRRIYVNPAVAQFYDVPVETLIGEPLGSGMRRTELDVKDEEIAQVRQRIADVFNTGESSNYELTWTMPTGRRHFSIRVFPELDLNGSVVNVLGISRDITERKEAEDSLREALVEINKLKDQLYKENIALREEIVSASMFEEIIGTSPALRQVLGMVEKVAPTGSTVLITGETGTGKELIARAIHKRSNRSEHVFMSVNCAAIPPALLASELFGHEKGAFTDALRQRLGRFELAEGGTIFLDEIGELLPETQVALLRVLQEHEFERVGGTKTIRADVRVIAATNRNLSTAISAGTFRRDLFYRLNVFPIEMPSLRERREDIPLLVEYFIHRYATKMGKKILRIDKKTLDMLASSEWPGNIRELQNVIERSVILNETETFTIDKSWLTHKSRQTHAGSALLDNLVTHEKEMIEASLAESRGQVAGPLGAAAKLGVPPSTLDSKIKALRINKHRFKTS